MADGEPSIGYECHEPFAFRQRVGLPSGAYDIIYHVEGCDGGECGITVGGKDAVPCVDEAGFIIKMFCHVESARIFKVEHPKHRLPLG